MEMTKVTLTPNLYLHDEWHPEEPMQVSSGESESGIKIEYTSCSKNDTRHQNLVFARIRTNNAYLGINILNEIP